MARWNDTVSLIKTAPPDGRQTDKSGFALPSTEQRRDVYCNKRSVGYSEFYKAQQTGYKAELKIDVYTDEYDKEELAEFDGKMYRVLRTYESKNGEITELTLSDLSQRSVGNG